MSDTDTSAITIGILAGMGPRATAPFVDLVIDKCQEIYSAKYDLDFPHMLIYSLPTPFYVDCDIDHKAARKTIGEGLKKLEDCGVSFIAMPCNSAHAYYGDLAAQINIPLLNMISETAKALQTKTSKTPQRIVILAAEMTLESGLYQRALVEVGAEIIDNRPWQNQVNQLILAIKNFASRVELQERWKELNNTLNKQRLDTILVACTDLNAIDLNIGSAAPLIDAGACLAEATVRRWHAVLLSEKS